MHLIINYDQKDVDLYNKKFKEIVENIRDFVLLHYLIDKKDSKFWSDFKPFLPTTLQDNLHKWSNRLPIDEDFSNNYVLFNADNFSVILNELNLLDKNKLKSEYNLLNSSLKKHVEEVIDNFTKHNKTINLLGHKCYLNSIKN